MNAQCERYRELAADVVNGVAEPAQVDRLEEHVADCAECRAYLEALRREDLLLAELVERLDTGMAGRRERLVGAIKGQHKQTRRSMKWSINMTSPLARMAAAAAIVFVVVLGAVFFPGSNVTFATVVEPILNAKTMIVDLVVGGEDGPVMHEIIVGGRIRRNMSNLPTLTQVLDLEGGRMLALDDTSKTAIYVDIAGDVQEGTKNYVEFLRQAIRQVQDAHVEGLGEREIDGVAAVGFVGRGENEEVTIWADAKTGHPLRIELTMGRDFRAAMKNFQFDVPVDAALVSMDVPEGYTLADMQVDLGDATEADFVEGLRIWAEIIGDEVFPDAIGTEEAMQQMPVLIQKLIARSIPEAEATTLGISFGRAMLFHQMLERRKITWGYAGAGVRFGDGGKAVFWYEPEGAATRRVIYGDLSVRDVAAADLQR